ncbi:NADH-quinone oxidoreductase subunit NuoE [Propionivibrio sp.]|uniref:NADH-quinone oxidoreductase subunit NuoE n=1 Tax=Propionivibrio sp. TaxID=2212460 RepID=UPI0025E584E0|nr:NADH-quinone oxidoreductase subunit NuoE [Propionivibrio sp.]MBK8744602.1 NADH-quinone oxidoreductase subunit NuoE [Propionivibrio sp.]MBK8893847.1 NADH-quinone oxidoreductase subunit NuoE [Propionivibrio sp.]
MLTTESLKRIDREIAKYPAEQKQSAVMAALAIAQEEQGRLSNEAIEFVADYLGMAPMAAYEVASFYSMYDLAAVGKYKLTVCTNLPCMLSGGVDAGEYLKNKLGVGFNETTADGKFTLKEGECMGACGDAPVMLVNNRRMCSYMQPDQIDKLLAELE